MFIRYARLAAARHRHLRRRSGSRRRSRVCLATLFGLFPRPGQLFADLAPIRAPVFHRALAGSLPDLESDNRQAIRSGERLRRPAQALVVEPPPGTKGLPSKIVPSTAARLHRDPAGGSNLPANEHAQGLAHASTATRSPSVKLASSRPRSDGTLAILHKSPDGLLVDLWRQQIEIMISDRRALSGSVKFWAPTLERLGFDPSSYDD